MSGFAGPKSLAGVDVDVDPFVPLMLRRSLLYLVPTELSQSNFCR